MTAISLHFPIRAERVSKTSLTSRIFKHMLASQERRARNTVALYAPDLAASMKPSDFS